MSKWDALDSHMHAGLPVWQAEKTRIDALRFWTGIAGMKDWPSSASVYHLHPIGLVGNFFKPSACECGCCLNDKIQVTRMGSHYGPAYWGTLTLANAPGLTEMLASGEITASEKRIIAAMAPNEGKLDSVQSYDDQVVTAGAMQKTIRPDNGGGEFATQPRRMGTKPCGAGTCLGRALWRHATHGKPGGRTGGARSLSKSQGNTRMTMCIATRLSLLIAALLASQQAWSAQDRPEMDFPNHARLIYSAPVSSELRRTFGPGWTRLTITQPDGSTLPIIPDEPLTAEGGVIFSTVGAAARSHDGRYVVLDITRNGATETEDGKPTVASREYCPILDTQTGCVARDYTGAVCGGTWDEQQAVWRSELDSGKQDSESMATLEKPTARSVWTQFSQAKTTDIKPFLRVALGLANLRACDPPSAENAAYYAQIQAALGDSSRTTSSSAPAGAVPEDLASAPVWTVKVDRSWLYERPSVGSNKHGYLVRGDHAAVIGEEKPDWVRIRYVRTGKAPLEAWLKRQDIAR